MPPMKDDEPPFQGPWGRPNGSSRRDPRSNRGSNHGHGHGERPDIPDPRELLGRLLDSFGRRGGSGNGSGSGSDGDGSGRRFGVKAVLFGVLVAVLGWGATGFYTVGPKELGVELIFGRANDVTRPGLHYNFPAPIGEVLRPEVTNVNQVEVGFRVGQSGATQGLSAESLMLTGDENIIDIQFAVFWRISDATKFLFNIRNPERSVKNVAEAAMREIIGKTDFEYARTSGRTRLALDAQELIQEILNNYESGIEIVNVNLQQVDPPARVIDAFRDVQAARADKESEINQATAYLNETVERAQGQAEQITQSAQAYKEENIAIAEGDAQRFLLVLNEYRNAKDITQRRIYLQTMEEIMGGLNKVLIDSGNGGQQGVLPYLPLDSLRPRPADSDDDSASANR